MHVRSILVKVESFQIKAFLYLKRFYFYFYDNDVLICFFFIYLIIKVTLYHAHLNFILVKHWLGFRD